jgi:hypothetical protein
MGGSCPRRSGRVALPKLDATADLQLESALRAGRICTPGALLLEPAPEKDELRLEVLPELGQPQRVIEPELAVAELGPFALGVRP